MPYKPFHPDIIGWKAFHPQTGRCYSPRIFPIPHTSEALNLTHTDYDYQTAASCFYVL